MGKQLKEGKKIETLILSEQEKRNLTNAVKLKTPFRKREVLMLMYETPTTRNQ
jgi:predicted amidophosphoribosyltransferase